MEQLPRTSGGSRLVRLLVLAGIGAMPALPVRGADVLARGNALATLIVATGIYLALIPLAVYACGRLAKHWRHGNAAACASTSVVPATMVLLRIAEPFGAAARWIMFGAVIVVFVLSFRYVYTADVRTRGWPGLLQDDATSRRE